jgi:hypothetical protein
VTTKGISKLEAAQRQLDCAIRLSETRIVSRFTPWPMLPIASYASC